MAPVSSRAFCLCLHEHQDHRGARGECRARITGQRYGRGHCPCVRFTEAPFAWQQPDLFTGDAAARLAAEFGGGVIVLDVGDHTNAKA